MKTMYRPNEDEIDDTDQENPVDMSDQSWSDLYSRRPELLEHGDDYDY